MADTFEHRLELMARDSSLPPALIASFGSWIRTAPDEDVYRIPLLPWAAQHGVDADTALALFLHAARVGILELQWAVTCPACGVSITTPGGLRALGPDPHCQLCQLDFPTSMDDQVEVIFSVESTVRRTRFHDSARAHDGMDTLRMYFSPSLVLSEMQTRLAGSIRGAVRTDPHASDTLDAVLEPGRLYAFMAANVHAVAFVECVEGAPTERSFELHDGGMIPPRAVMGPGAIRVAISNRTRYPSSTGVFDLGPHDGPPSAAPPGTDMHYTLRPFLSGKRVLTSQTFRDLFRGEHVGDSGLRIKNLAVVFTDLEASTALYERVGDLRALALVREHFDRLGEAVSRHQGAVVKTIGDAVMAAFGEPDRAVAAAAGMVRAARKIDADGVPLQVKVGVHSGSCIAIQTNHQIDYFGTAVNIASRVQALARGGEIVVTDTIWNAPGVRELSEDYGLGERPDVVDLRGIATGVSVHRLT